MLALLFQWLLLISVARSTTLEEAGNDNGNVNVPAMSSMFEEGMRPEKVDVLFSAGGDGALTMTVTHHGDNIVCSGLADDLSDVTEIRQSDGSFKEVRGTDGYSLRSSVDGIECRVALLNAHQRPYTQADVPHPPGYLSAHIVLSNGDVLDVERDAATGNYIHLCPHHVPHGQRRRLQSFHAFSCKLGQLKNLRMGVVIDQAFLTDADNNRDTARQKLLDLFRKVSVPYEKQFNVKIKVAQLLFHDDPLVQGERWARCGVPNNHLNSFTAWRSRKVPKKMAGWYFAIGCNHQPGVAGVAWLGTMGKSGGGRSTGVGFTQLVTTAHEIGHNFGMEHTFDSPHNQRQGAGNGIMDYTRSGKWQDVFQFHSMHDRETCNVLKNMVSGGSSYVSLEEMWDTGSPTPTTQRPPTPSPPPSTARPPTPSPPPGSAPPPTPTPSPPPGSAPPPTPTPSPPPSTTRPPTSGEEPESGSYTPMYIILVAVAILLLCCFMRRKSDEPGEERNMKGKSVSTKQKRSVASMKTRMMNRPKVQRGADERKKKKHGVRRSVTEKQRSPKGKNERKEKEKSRSPKIKNERKEKEKSRSSKIKNERKEREKSRSSKIKNESNEKEKSRSSRRKYGPSRR